LASGKICYLALERGFGFIQEDGSKEELEFHWTAVTAGGIDQLEEGQSVEFDKVPHRRSSGRNAAINVRLARTDQR
jgi:cold shock CspA family protein